jgi:hypothetical protein
LPTEEQGSYALVIAASGGALLKMPLFPASANRIETSVEASMNANGGINANLQRQYFGQSGIPLRAVDKLRSHEELQKRFERGFTRRLGGVTIKSVAANGSADDRLAVNVDLTAEHFGQMMQDRLLIVRPGALSSGGEYVFTSRKRSSPVKLEDLRHDPIKVKLPAASSGRASRRPGERLRQCPGDLGRARREISDGANVDSRWRRPISAKVRDFFDKAGVQGASRIVRQ